MKNLIPAILITITLLSGCQKQQDIYVMPLMAGEVTHNSIILQTRLTTSDTIAYGDIHHPDSIIKGRIAGKQGWGRFTISDQPDLSDPIISDWLEATDSTDYIIKFHASTLDPSTQYYYTVEFNVTPRRPFQSQVQTFNTLPDPDSVSSGSFVMVTGSHHIRFYLGGGFGKASGQGTEAYKKDDKYLGFPAYDAIRGLDPDFYIGNGDNVYYDHPPTLAATTQEDMRAHWQRLFYMPRFRDLLSEVPVYWMMDDHDHRFNDSDTLNPHSSIGDDPSHELAMHTFAEQLPFTTGNWRETDFYRTVEMGNLLQVWMVEGRRYRSPNNQPDGTGKTLWGEEQIEWLKQSLLNSDAPFKILASPTPLIGPDDSYKNDNHTNPGGFRYERDAFFAWLKDNGFDDQHFYFICGDRHWKYHSIDPSGFEEYSCGALVDQNSRLGREPGDPKSTDPEGLIQQPFLDPVATGGFLHVAVETGSDSSHPTLTFSMFDDEGNLLYEDVKTSAASLVPGGKN